MEIDRESSYIRVLLRRTEVKQKRRQRKDLVARGLRFLI
jgi:hypothetical protein